MFDGNPEASCAFLEVSGINGIISHHLRVHPVQETLVEEKIQSLLEIHLDMYRLG